MVVKEIKGFFSIFIKQPRHHRGNGPMMLIHRAREAIMAEAIPYQYFQYSIYI